MASEFLGWSAETWAVVVGAVAAVAAVAGVVVAVIKKPAEPKPDPEELAARKRELELREEAAEQERQRAARERMQILRERDPEWEPAEDGPAGYFTSDSSELVGALRNVGLHIAKVTGAYLDFDGQRSTFAVKCDPAQGGGGYIATATVPPQAVMSMRCDVRGMRLDGLARPSIYIDFEGLGGVTGDLGVTIPLLRNAEDPRGHALWKLGTPRYALMP
jgi:hypothetical protein